LACCFSRCWIGCAGHRKSSVYPTPDTLLPAKLNFSPIVMQNDMARGGDPYLTYAA